MKRSGPLWALWNVRDERYDYVDNDAGGLHEVWAYDKEHAAEDARQSMFEPDEWRVVRLEER